MPVRQGRHRLRRALHPPGPALRPVLRLPLRQRRTAARAAREGPGVHTVSPVEAPPSPLIMLLMGAPRRAQPLRRRGSSRGTATHAGSAPEARAWPDGSPELAHVPRRCPWALLSAWAVRWRWQRSPRRPPPSAPSRRWTRRPLASTQLYTDVARTPIRKPSHTSVPLPMPYSAVVAMCVAEYVQDHSGQGWRIQPDAGLTRFRCQQLNDCDVNRITPIVVCRVSEITGQAK